MPGHALRGLRGALCAAALAAAGCDAAPAEPETDLERGAAYVASASYRRAALEAALVNPDNGYSALRLARYTEAAWGALPEWRPRVRPVRASDLGAPPPTPDASWEAAPAAVAWSDEALRALGAWAFETYPSQLEPALGTALASPEALARYGLHRAGDRVVGLVWVELPGGVQPAFTCAACHAGPDAAGAPVPGLPNHRFDYGALLDDHHGAHTANSRWGPGRVDVNPDGLENAATIADLRPVRLQHHLHRSASVTGDLVSLAVRLETGFISDSGQSVRPPRPLVFALALYLWSLADELPEPPTDTPGAAVFAARCARCHAPPALSGPPVPLADIGTDPSVGASPWRTTGRYQTPSLRGVARRGRLFAAGGVASLDALLDPEREAPGHPHGLDLGEADREALLAFLRTLE